METVTIERLGREVRQSDVEDLARLLVDAVEAGAGVSFLAGLSESEAAGWWHGVLAAPPDRTIVLVARDRDGIVGTVQLQRPWPPNQAHRADVAKLIVHRRARRRGIARALMVALERTAKAAGLALLLLDTCRGSDAERLYAAMGWIRVGEVPKFATNPDGSMCDTVFFYKTLTP